DPGARLVREAIGAGVRVEAIPGPSAVLAALTVSGFPADHFTFLGFPPTRRNERARWFERLRQSVGTVIFFESPHRIQSTLEELQSIVGECPTVVARELTKLHEELVRGPITPVLEQLSTARGEYTVVVEIGHKPDSTEAPAIVEASSRRKALAALAQAHGLT